MSERTAAKPATEAKPKSNSEKSVVSQPRKSRALLKLIRRNYHVLTVIGAFIVFCTFIVRDAWRERLRDFGESLDKAENTYFIRNDSAALRFNLQEFRDSFEMFMSERRTQWISERGLEQSRRVAFISREYVENDALVLEASEQLLEKLPAGIHLQHRAELETIRRERENFERQHEEWSKIYLDFEQRKPRVDKALELSQEMMGTEGEFYRRIQALAGTVLREARRVKAANEYSYEVATRVMYALFFVGWALGLAGSLAGAKGLRESSD